MLYECCGKSLKYLTTSSAQSTGSDTLQAKIKDFFRQSSTLKYCSTSPSLFLYTSNKLKNQRHSACFLLDLCLSLKK